MRITAAIRNVMLDELGDLADNGFLRIYSGTRPANADTALSGNTLLAELGLNAAAFGAASGGVITAGAITSEDNAPATGTATFARMFAANGTTVLGDFSVGTSNAEVLLSTTAIAAGVVVSCSSFTITLPVGA